MTRHDTANMDIFSCFSLGLDGAKWTTDSHANALKITAGEAATIGHVFSLGDFSEFYEGGVVVEGIKYQFLRYRKNTRIGLHRITR